MSRRPRDKHGDLCVVSCFEFGSHESMKRRLWASGIFRFLASWFPNWDTADLRRPDGDDRFARRSSASVAVLLARVLHQIFGGQNSSGICPASGL